MTAAATALIAEQGHPGGSGQIRENASAQRSIRVPCRRAQAIRVGLSTERTPLPSRVTARSWPGAVRSMTAEVVVLNRQGLAMAADSAVTVRRTGPESSPAKIYNSGNKLFQLSRSQPIGIMTYNNASYESVPWEIVVKEFRRAIGDSYYSTVAEYGERFIGHLRYLASRLPWSLDGKYVQDLASSELANVYTETLIDVRSKLIDAGFSESSLSGTQIVDSLKNAIDQRRSRLTEAGFFESISVDSATASLRNAIPNWEEFFAASSPLQGSAIDSSIQDVAFDLIVTAIRSCMRSYAHSGIVIAGFGEKEIFPSLVHYDVDGVVGGALRLRESEPESIDPYKQCSIRSFAQSDVIETMIYGMHFDVNDVLKKYLATSLRKFGDYVLNRYSAAILDAEKAALSQDIDDHGLAVVENFQRDIGRYLKSTYADPILGTVEGLPKEQLAEIAEALVSLTSFQRRVTPGDESVGGPVDLAVISKGDGFVWIKRKHYFSAELNPRYMNRLVREDVRTPEHDLASSSEMSV